MTNLGDEITRRRVLDRLTALRPDTRGCWGRMSAHQMICHLCDSFQVGTGEKTASPSREMGPPWLIKLIALYAPVHWPKGIPTRPEMEQGVGGTPPEDFEKDRQGLIRVIQRFAEPGRDYAHARHPMFGAMKPNQWLRWGYLHADHHLRQFGL